MANLKSQIKRIRTSETARIRNVSIKSEVRTGIKKTEKLIASADAVAAKKSFIETVTLIDKSISSNVINQKAGARYKSRLQHLINGLK